jgi:predicted DCC family thiol-disulfide oxidoreductase YuxK
MDSATGGPVTGDGSTSRNQRIEVFYDGRCPVCRASRAWAERRDRGCRLDWIDATDPNFAERLPASAAELARAVGVRRRDGTLASGYRAWLAVLLELPGWRTTARVLALPPLAWFGPPAYRLIAAFRHRFGAERRG